MATKLKNLRAGNRTAVTKLLAKFEELKQKSDVELEEVKFIEDGLTQKQKTLEELNANIMEIISEEEVEEEFSNADEYMFNLGYKVQQIRKFVQTIKKTKTQS